MRYKMKKRTITMRQKIPKTRTSLLKGLIKTLVILIYKSPNKTMPTFPIQKMNMFL